VCQRRGEERGTPDHAVAWMPSSLAQVRNRHDGRAGSIASRTVSPRITAGANFPRMTIGTPRRPSVSPGASTTYSMLSKDERGGGKHGLLLRKPSRPSAAYWGNVGWTTVTGAPAGRVRSADSKHSLVPDESWSAANILGVPSGAITVNARAAAETSSVRGSLPHAEMKAMPARAMMQDLNPERGRKISYSSLRPRSWWA
jgi:hypothetical protein